MVVCRSHYCYWQSPQGDWLDGVRRCRRQIDRRHPTETTDKWAFTVLACLVTAKFHEEHSFNMQLDDCSLRGRQCEDSWGRLHANSDCSDTRLFCSPIVFVTFYNYCPGTNFVQLILHERKIGGRLRKPSAKHSFGFCVFVCHAHLELCRSSLSFS